MPLRLSFPSGILLLHLPTLNPLSPLVSDFSHPPKKELDYAVIEPFQN
jgi:hypothetical protein